MKKTPLTVIALLLAVVLGAGITWAIIHIRFTNATIDNLDDAFYAFVIKEPHDVPSVEEFKTALDSVKSNSPQDTNVSFCFQLEGEKEPLEYGPQDPPCQDQNQPNMPALTHKIYSVSPLDIVEVVSKIGGKVASTPTPTPTPTP